MRIVKQCSPGGNNPRPEARGFLVLLFKNLNAADGVSAKNGARRTGEICTSLATMSLASRARNGIFSIRSARSRRRKMRGRGPTAGEAIVRELDFRPVRSRNDELCDCTAHGRQLDHLRGEASASHETAISTGGLSGASKGRIFAWRMQRRRRHSSRSAKTSLLGMAMLNGRDHVQNVARSAR